MAGAASTLLHISAAALIAQGPSTGLIDCSDFDERDLVSSLSSNAFHSVPNPSFPLPWLNASHLLTLFWRQMQPLSLPAAWPASARCY